MVYKKDPTKQAINQHLWRAHSQTAGSGTVTDRLALHDTLHAESNDYPYAGDPLHRHENATHESVGEVIQHEGEGT